MKKIAIHSVPRSGSTWLGNIFNSHPEVNFRYQPLFSYAFKDYLKVDSSNLVIDQFFLEINKSKDSFINQEEAVDKGLIPAFSKAKEPQCICYKEVRYHHIIENMLQKNKTIKFVFLIRNPLAVIHSWSKAPKEFNSNWNLQDEWLDAPKKNLNKPEEFNGYNKWKETAINFLRLSELYPKQTCIVNYSDLLKNTEQEVTRIFNFCDLNLNKSTKYFLNISRMKNDDDAYSVFKSKIKDDKWLELPENIIKYITEDVKGTNLERFLYE